MFLIAIIFLKKVWLWGFWKAKPIMVCSWGICVFRILVTNRDEGHDTGFKVLVWGIYGIGPPWIYKSITTWKRFRTVEPLRHTHRTVNARDRRDKIVFAARCRESKYSIGSPINRIKWGDEIIRSDDLTPVSRLYWMSSRPTHYTVTGYYIILQLQIYISMRATTAKRFNLIFDQILPVTITRELNYTHRFSSWLCIYLYLV